MNRAPGPRGWLISGSLLAFWRNPLTLMTRAVDDYGDVVRFRFAHITAHLLNSPDHIEHVLSRNAANYDKDTRSVEQIRATCGDSLMSANADAWARHRRLFQPVFQPRAVAGLAPQIDAYIQPMLDRWSAVARAGGQVDIVAEMMELVIGLATQLLFSAQVDPVRISNALDILLADTWRRLQMPLDPSVISPRFHRRAFKAARAQIDQVVLDLIRSRRGAGVQPDDVLSRLIAAHEAEGEGRLTDTELRDAAVTLLLAGHETTANALAWMFWLMARQPERQLMCADPQHLFSEALRLYPSIWIIERRVICADQIGGYQIPAGSTVLISPYLLHRNPVLWPDPQQFDPTRFDPEQAALRPRHAYLPFGLGPHRCIGLHLARLMAERIIQNIRRDFCLTAADATAQPIQPGITLRPVAPIMLNLHLR